ncbi:hypothetical protein FS837_002977 [Tulasnella sp. UAMH 9824]|nr:hypothetical protein FS837_002977 [Tulasnella sp. UAMH 9824]
MRAHPPHFSAVIRCGAGRRLSCLPVASLCNFYAFKFPLLNFLSESISSSRTSTIRQHHTYHSLLEVSHTSQKIEDDPIAAKKIANLRATIANLQFKRDNYLADIQQALITNICPGVRVWQKNRDDQMKELEWAKADLAKKAEVRDIMEAEQREEVAVDKEWQEKLKRCDELEREVQRLLFQQDQWVARGWRRRDWKSDGEPNSEPTSEVSPEQYSASPTSLQRSSYGSNSSANSRSQLEGTRSTAPMTMSKWTKQGPFAVAARRQPPTQGSDSIESEMLGATTRTHSRARTSQNIRGMLDDFGQQTEGSGSRQGPDITYEDFP